MQSAIALSFWLLASSGAHSVGNPAPQSFPTTRNWVGDAQARKFQVSNCQNADDTVQIQGSTRQLTLVVRSPRGIGYCTIAARKGTWPAQVTVLLQGFREVEDLQLNLGRMQIQGSRKTSGQFALFFKGKDHQTQRLFPIGTISATVEPRPSGIAIIFPTGLFIEADSVVLRWIDWFRS